MKATRNRSNVTRHWKDNSIDSAASLECQETSKTEGQQIVSVFVISAVESNTQYSLRSSSRWRFVSAISLPSIGWIAARIVVRVSPDNVRFLLMLSALSEDEIFRHWLRWLNPCRIEYHFELRNFG